MSIHQFGQRNRSNVLDLQIYRMLVFLLQPISWLRLLLRWDQMQKAAIAAATKLLFTHSAYHFFGGLFPMEFHGFSRFSKVSRFRQAQCWGATKLLLINPLQLSADWIAQNKLHSLIPSLIGPCWIKCQNKAKSGPTWHHKVFFMSCLFFVIGSCRVQTRSVKWAGNLVSVFTCFLLFDIFV